MKKAKMLDLSAKVEDLQAQVNLVNNYIDEVLYTKQVNKGMAFYSLFNRGGLDTASKNLDKVSEELQDVADRLVDDLDRDDIGGGTDD